MPRKRIQHQKEEFLPQPLVEYFNYGEYELYIAPSKIPNAGFGVFTREEILKESIIGYYTGDIKHTGQVPNHFHYIFELNEHYYIDGYTNPRNMMAVINDAHHTPFENNCEFVLNYNPKTLAPNALHEQLVGIRAIEDIFPDEELLIDYGPDYWKW